MGLERIGLAGPNDNANVLVLEDSPAGIKAGKAAGCKVLGLVTRQVSPHLVLMGSWKGAAY